MLGHPNPGTVSSILNPVIRGHGGTRHPVLHVDVVKDLHFGFDQFQTSSYRLRCLLSQEYWCAQFVDQTTRGCSRLDGVSIHLLDTVALVFDFSCAGPARAVTSSLDALPSVCLSTKPMTTSSHGWRRPMLRSTCVGLPHLERKQGTVSEFPLVPSWRKPSPTLLGRLFFSRVHFGRGIIFFFIFFFPIYDR